MKVRANPGRCSALPLIALTDIQHFTKVDSRFWNTEKTFTAELKPTLKECFARKYCTGFDS